MDRSQFVERVEHERREHPRWFDLAPDRAPTQSQRAAIEAELGVLLPDDYAWFLEKTLKAACISWTAKIRGSRQQSSGSAITGVETCTRFPTPTAS